MTRCSTSCTTFKEKFRVPHARSPIPFASMPLMKAGVSLPKVPLAKVCLRRRCGKSRLCTLQSPAGRAKEALLHRVRNDHARRFVVRAFSLVCLPQCTRIIAPEQLTVRYVRNNTHRYQTNGLASPRELHWRKQACTRSRTVRHPRPVLHRELPRADSHSRSEGTRP